MAGSAWIHLGYEPWQKIHSEPVAYKRARGILEQSKPIEAVNIRLTRTKKIKDSKPCNCCFQFLKAVNCSFVWHTTDLETFSRLSI